MKTIGTQVGGRRSQSQPTTYREEMGIVWSLKLASRAPPTEYTHSSRSPASTKRLLPLASRKRVPGSEVSSRLKEATCWAERERDSNVDQVSVQGRSRRSSVCLLLSNYYYYSQFHSHVFNVFT